MFGVEYSYYDQFESTRRILPVAFTSKEKAQAWIDDRIDAPYLRSIDLEVDPLPAPKFKTGQKVTRSNGQEVTILAVEREDSGYVYRVSDGKDTFGVGESHLR
jgi:hypothetical protein